ENTAPRQRLDSQRAIEPVETAARPQRASVAFHGRPPAVCHAVRSAVRLRRTVGRAGPVSLGVTDRLRACRWLQSITADSWAIRESPSRYSGNIPTPRAGRLR